MKITRFQSGVILTCLLLAAAIGFAQSVPKKIPFVIGGSNTAKFLQGDHTAERDEHRSEIDNFSNTSGNHGWVELETAGYELVRIAEGQGSHSGNLNVAPCFR